MTSKGYPPTLFIIGTDRNIGKTVTSMGIVSKLLSAELGYAPEEIGYIKPLGQQTRSIRGKDGNYLEVDKDVLLFTNLYQLDCPDYRAMSPVVWDRGSTEKYIDAASQGSLRVERSELCRQIREAYKVVAEGKKVVVSEGTGQPGVGSVVGLSNGDVVNLLKEMGVPVITILVARGGIGSTIDRIFPQLLSLNCIECQVDGLIINAVRLSKLDKVRTYLKLYYKKAFPELYCSLSKVGSPPPILGFIPEVPELGFPTMRLLMEAFIDEQMMDLRKFARTPRSKTSDRFVRGIKVLSLDSGFEPYLKDGDVLIVGINANETIMSLLSQNAKARNKGHQGLTGLILSCSRATGLKVETINAILESDVPTMVLPNDSADIVRRIAKMSVKIQPYDVAKKKYVDLAYQNHLDFSWIMGRLRQNEPNP